MTRHILVCASMLACAASPAFSATVAYYRFEDQPTNGAFLDANAGGSPFETTLDSSGNGNHMRNFNAPDINGPAAPGDSSPRYVSGLTPTVLQTGAANNFALDFGAGSGGDNQNNDDLYVGVTPTGTSLNGALDNGSTFTIELFVRADDTDRWATFVGRDNFGEQAGEPDLGLAYFQRSNDGGVNTQNRIKFQAEDKAGNTAFVFSQNPMVPGVTYHVAAVGDGTNLSLYVDGVLQNSTAFSGLFDSGNEMGWTIGRGFFNGVADWWDGQIDEVRFSDTALAPGQFLNAVPEPSSLALLGLVSLAMRRRR